MKIRRRIVNPELDCFVWNGENIEEFYSVFPEFKNNKKMWVQIIPEHGTDEPCLMMCGLLNSSIAPNPGSYIVKLEKGVYKGYLPDDFDKFYEIVK